MMETIPGWLIDAVAAAGLATAYAEPFEPLAATVARKPESPPEGDPAHLV